MVLTMNYSELASKCLRWAETAENSDAFEAYLALAEIWKRIADLEHRAGARSVRPSQLFQQLRTTHHRSDLRTAQ